MLAITSYVCITYFLTYVCIDFQIIACIWELEQKIM